MEDGDKCAWLVHHTVETDDGPVITLVDCGAAVETTEYGWRCDVGHSHERIETAWEPFGSEWQQEQKEKATW